MAIEFNGTYWHSLHSKWYHQIKVELCNRKGIRLLHIYEWEWLFDKQKCLNKINLYMENLEVKILPRKPTARFVQENIEKKYLDVNKNRPYFIVWD